jgi:hypothetical protein
MKSPAKKLGAIGIAVAAAVGVAMMVDLDGNQTAATMGDFRNATTAEVRDAQGTVLLRGTFAATAGDNDKEIERKATLTATSPGGTATGEAEVEYQTDKADVQEVEFNVTGVPARAIVTLVLDGRDVVAATANDKGEAEAEVNVNTGQPRTP